MGTVVVPLSMPGSPGSAVTATAEKASIAVVL